MDRHGDSASEIMVNPLSPIRRVEKKGRKWRALEDPSWDETFRENLEKVGVKPPEAPKRVEEFNEETREQVHPEELPIDRDAELTINSSEDFERVLGEIKKMADDPEKLVESHIKVFIEPVSNGKWIDSQG
jgi:hypothetical protein